MYETKSDLQNLVRMGADWLDSHAGPGWWNKINLDRLSLYSDTDCILGQVFADVVRPGLNWDRNGRPVLSGFGFAVNHWMEEFVSSKDGPTELIRAFMEHQIINGPDMKYYTTSQAWRELILQRRKNDKRREEDELIVAEMKGYAAVDAKPCYTPLYQYYAPPKQTMTFAVSAA